MRGTESHARAKVNVRCTAGEIGDTSLLLQTFGREIIKEGWRCHRRDGAMAWWSGVVAVVTVVVVVVVEEEELYFAEAELVHTIFFLYCPPHSGSPPRAAGQASQQVLHVVY